MERLYDGYVLVYYDGALHKILVWKGAYPDLPFYTGSDCVGLWKVILKDVPGNDRFRTEGAGHFLYDDSTVYPDTMYQQLTRMKESRYKKGL